MKKIKEWFENNAWWLIIIIVICSVVSISSYIAWSDLQNDKKITIKGTITNVDTIEDEDLFRATGLILTFNDGEQYKIKTFEEYIDFTVNSEMLITLSWNGDDDYWRIESMYKVPSEVE